MIEYWIKVQINFVFTVKDSGKDFKSNWKLIKMLVNYGLKNKLKFYEIKYFSIFGKNKFVIF